MYYQGCRCSAVWVTSNSPLIVLRRSIWCATCMVLSTRTCWSSAQHLLFWSTERGSVGSKTGLVDLQQGWLVHNRSRLYTEVLLLIHCLRGDRSQVFQQSGLNSPPNVHLCGVMFHVRPPYSFLLHTFPVRPSFYTLIQQFI